MCSLHFVFSICLCYTVTSFHCLYDFIMFPSVHSSVLQYASVNLLHCYSLTHLYVYVYIFPLHVISTTDLLYYIHLCLYIYSAILPQNLTGSLLEKRTVKARKNNVQCKEPQTAGCVAFLIFDSFARVRLSGTRIRYIFLRERVNPSDTNLKHFHLLFSLDRAQPQNRSSTHRKNHLFIK